LKIIGLKSCLHLPERFTAIETENEGGTDEDFTSGKNFTHDGTFL
jgi:hypothetical protein